MSEQAPEQTPTDPATQAAEAPAPAAASSGEPTYPIRLVKRLTGDVHWNVAAGIWETITHAETGEPNAEYALLATIDGVDVTLETFNAGGVETIIRAAQQAQQPPAA